MAETKLVVNTTKFGEVEIEEELVFDFVMPIIGFEKLEKYILIDYKPESPFKWLQSVEDGDLAFPVTMCSCFGLDYQFDIPDNEAKKLDIKSPEDVFVMNIANIPQSNPQGVTVNMLAPLIINVNNKKAGQIVLKNTEFEVRKRLFE